jgi:hypothetical protein
MYYNRRRQADGKHNKGDSEIMFYVVYMKSKTGTPRNTMLGVFLSEGDAQLFFKENNWESDMCSFHMEEIDCVVEWFNIKKKLP